MQPRITINIGESASSAQLRRLIRDRHAAWSQETFGDVGPVGPLKHLAKEALEAAAASDDLSEWADLQFLLWDAQRRAGISDGEITAAMEEKLKVNMARQWPEPKDGEPRLHIKEFGNSPVIPDGWESCKHLLPIGELIHRLEEQTGEKWIYAKDAIPDGYVMVPIEPTEDMIVYGFESEPDEDFSDPAVWEEYQAMSGCQQAAHRAKLCWAAMIAAAPKPGDSNG
ncbi:MULTISPECIES: dATP/dGTP pyrophosphohydrolase domain-containing protein [Enterobacter cloacae complex]|uniref:dATP/dGTP pyrophosphohydrolase domain-containing protein n=1 Tax=Enterobacter cloacae complex TaxID=354276 RepID=UPI0035D4AF9E